MAADSKSQRQAGADAAVVSIHHLALTKRAAQERKRLILDAGVVLVCNSLKPSSFHLTEQSLNGAFPAGPFEPRHQSQWVQMPLSARPIVRRQTFDQL